MFGTGSVGRVVSYYIMKWKVADICAYTVDSDYCEASSFLGKPVVACEAIAKAFSPTECAAFVAIGYADGNQLRAEKLRFMKSQGYSLISVLNPNLPPAPRFVHGDNCFVAPDDEFILVDVTLGSNVFIWNKCSIGHDVNIGDNTWMSTGTIVGGNTSIGQNCFIAMGAIMANDIAIGTNCTIGMGATVKKSIADRATVLAQAAKVLPCAEEEWQASCLPDGRRRSNE